MENFKNLLWVRLHFLLFTIITAFSRIQTGATVPLGVCTITYRQKRGNFNHFPRSVNTTFLILKIGGAQEHIKKPQLLHSDFCSSQQYQL
jgi:hypothetical protein